jgi:preprotein translocase subunit SecF
MGLLRDLYRGDNRIDFPRLWPRMLVASAVLVLIGVGALYFRGLQLGIDFEGGTVYELDAPGVTVPDAREVLVAEGYGNARIQTTQGGRVRVQTDIEDPAEAAALGAVLAEEIGPIESLEQVGPTWGEEITEKAVSALVWFFVVLALYIAVRLEWRMSIGALVAVVHDILLSVGVYALFQFEVTPGTVVAFLTIMGYSMYDTVVVYDKVKDVEARLGPSGKYTYTELMNFAMNRVLMRSVNTTITSMIPVVSIVVVGSLLLGATTLQEFGIALLVGLLVGAYSSVSVAAVVVVRLKEREPRYREIRQRVEARGGTGSRMIDRDEATGVAAGAGGRPSRPGGRTAAGASRSTSAGRSSEPVDAVAVADIPAPGAGLDPPSGPSPAAGSVIPPRPRKKRRR